MGNLVRVAEGEAAPSGMDAVHGVVHRLKPADMAKLTNMEHEYRRACKLAPARRRRLSPLLALLSSLTCLCPACTSAGHGVWRLSSAHALWQFCCTADQWSSWRACTPAARSPASPSCPLTTGSLRTASRPASATSTCCEQVGVGDVWLSCAWNLLAPAAGAIDTVAKANKPAAGCPIST